MAFVKYKNAEGNSGVTAYEVADKSIKIVFTDAVYVYTYKKPGKKQVEKMKQLATQGKGLSTYISRYIRDNYEEKYLLET